MCSIMLLSFASNYTGAQMQGVMSYFIIAMVILLVARGWHIMVVIMMVVVLVVTGGGGAEEEYDDECYDCRCLLCYLNMVCFCFTFAAATPPSSTVFHQTFAGFSAFHHPDHLLLPALHIRLDAVPTPRLP
jgi:hypothetical protein